LHTFAGNSFTQVRDLFELKGVGMNAWHLN